VILHGTSTTRNALDATRNDYFAVGTVPPRRISCRLRDWRTSELSAKARRHNGGAKGKPRHWEYAGFPGPLPRGEDLAAAGATLPAIPCSRAVTLRTVVYGSGFTSPLAVGAFAPGAGFGSVGRRVTRENENPARVPTGAGSREPSRGSSGSLNEGSGWKTHECARRFLTKRPAQTAIGHSFLEVL
jgi:hypothetical protein